MKEHFTEALVLDKEIFGELDQRVFLYTQLLGKIAAKVRSGRRITSKLSPHLEPLNFVQVRLIEKNGFQIADALRISRLPVQVRNFKILKLIKASVFDGHPDLQLWSLLKKNIASELTVLKLLGFDYALAVCQICGNPKPEIFSFRDSDYFCKRCLAKNFNADDYLELTPVVLAKMAF